MARASTSARPELAGPLPVHNSQSLMSTDVLTPARPVWHHAVASFLPVHTRSRAGAWIQRLPLGLILLASGPAAARQGWAITSLAFLGLAVIDLAVAVIVAIRVKGGITETIRAITEDIAWFKRLVKRNANAS